MISRYTSKVKRGHSETKLYPVNDRHAYQPGLLWQQESTAPPEKNKVIPFQTVTHRK